MPEPSSTRTSIQEVIARDGSLSGYADNALLLFALSIYLPYEDIAELAAESLTDGPDDKKLDICHLDLNEGRAVLAQGYLATTWGRPAAPANKASDLNTAISWLLSADEDEIPERLKTKATEVRDALRTHDIQRIELLYIHNCDESDNVDDELRAAANGAKVSAEQIASNSVEVTYKELGRNRIRSMYDALEKQIQVDKTLALPVTDYFTETSDDWSALVTSMPGRWFRQLYLEHGDDLFSANLRDFLGVTRRKGDINAGIQKTAASEPKHFWVFNNGVTALTHKIRRNDESVEIDGISIINGAQTTGALGGTENDHTHDVKVPCRIVECDNPDLVERIIRYNNTQNIIRPSDLRSNHPAQKRLEQAFQQYGINYVVRRQSGRNPANSISAEAVAQALCSFHGDPQTASRNRREIFEVDSTFEKVFPQAVECEHIYLVHTFSLAIDRVKLELKHAVTENTATDLQRRQYEVLKYSLAKQVLLYLIGASAEELLGKRVPSVIDWKAKSAVVKPAPGELADCCESVIKTLTPHIATQIRAEGSPYEVTRSATMCRKVAESLRATIASLEPSLGPQFQCIRDNTIL